jgi:hypothetical protein
MNSPAGGFCGGAGGCIGMFPGGLLAGAGGCAGGVAGCPPGITVAGGVPAGIIGSTIEIQLPPIKPGVGCNDDDYYSKKDNCSESLFIYFGEPISSFCSGLALERGCGFLVTVFYLYFICHLITSVWLVDDVKR